MNPPVFMRMFRFFVKFTFPCTANDTTRTLTTELTEYGASRHESTFRKMQTEYREYFKVEEHVLKQPCPNLCNTCVDAIFLHLTSNYILLQYFHYSPTFSANAYISVIFTQQYHGIIARDGRYSKYKDPQYKIMLCHSTNTSLPKVRR